MPEASGAEGGGGRAVGMLVFGTVGERGRHRLAPTVSHDSEPEHRALWFSYLYLALAARSRRASMGVMRKGR